MIINKELFISLWVQRYVNEAYCYWNRRQICRWFKNFQMYTPVYEDPLSPIVLSDHCKSTSLGVYPIAILNEKKSKGHICFMEIDSWKNFRRKFSIVYTDVFLGAVVYIVQTRDVPWEKIGPYYDHEVFCSCRLKLILKVNLRQFNNWKWFNRHT